MEAAAEEIQDITPTEAPPNDDSPVAEKTPTSESTKKSKKEDKSKKDDKNVEQFMKSLNSLPSIDEKYSTVCKKYMQTAEDNKKLLFYIKQCDKRQALLTKEKEHLQHEYNKTILVKSKLENLCRELQKQNKAIKEESLLKIREEEERRKETQAKFQNTLTEITALLQQNNEKNAKLRDDNISMTEKFKSVVQQYQLREQQVDKMAKQMQLESQLADAKLQKASLEHQAERERLVAEMEQLKVIAAQYKAKIIELQGQESSLKGQLALYTDKYDEFQNALVKSNQVFGGFKEQMEMMSKKIKKLEKESLSWKKRWETSQTALIDMCTERQGGEERAAAVGRQLQHMQGLCRTLQAERTVLLNTLKENNIERPPLPVPPPAPVAPPPAPAPAPSNASNAKMDSMVANCAQLRQSLAHLQSQLNVLTNNKNGNQQQQPAEEPVKPEKTKKSKSKKNKAEKQVEREKANASKGLENDDNKNSATADESNVTVTDMPKDVNKNSTEVENEAQLPNDKMDDTTVENLLQSMDLNKISSEVEIETQSPDSKIDDATMENLLNAIDLANKNLCSLEVVNDNNTDVSNIALEKSQSEISNELPVVELKTECVEIKSMPDNENPTIPCSNENASCVMEEVKPATEASP